MSLLRIACSLTLAPLHCQWSFDDGSAARVIGEGTPGQVPQDLVKRAGHIHLMVRAAQVLLTRTQLPVATGRRPDSLLAYAVEDKTASEPDANQVTRLGSAGGADVVAVVDRKALESWRMALGSAGIRSFEVRAETLMLPLLAGQWSVAWDGREGFVRSGALEGGATDCGDRGSPPLSLLLMLDEARARDEAPDSIALYLTAPDALPDLAEWQRRLGVALLPAQHWDWRSAPAQPGIDLGT